MSRFGIPVSAGLGLLLCSLLLSDHPARAALDLTTPAVNSSEMEIVVVEVSGCIYCHLFRRDVWPTYEASVRSRDVPMRFVDLNSEKIAGFELERPIESVPTALVLRRGREVGRIPGYVGPEAFFHSIDRLLASQP